MVSLHQTKAEISLTVMYITQDNMSLFNMVTWNNVSPVTAQYITSLFVQ